MASQLLDDPKIDSPEPFLLRDILPGPAWAPFQAESGQLHRAIDYASVAMVEEENCPRAVLVAFCVEAAIALGLYGGWHMLHLIR